MLVIVNPPTPGIYEYVIDDQPVHSLITDPGLPLSRSREGTVELWTRRVTAAQASVPAGAHAVWGRDGALTFVQCLKVWTRYATPRWCGASGGGRRAPGWAILRKRLYAMAWLQRRRQARRKANRATGRPATKSAKCRS